MLEEEFELGVVNIFAWCPVLLLVALKMSSHKQTDHDDGLMHGVVRCPCPCRSSV